MEVESSSEDAQPAKVEDSNSSSRIQSTIRRMTISLIFTGYASSLVALTGLIKGKDTQNIKLIKANFCLVFLTSTFLVFLWVTRLTKRLTNPYLRVVVFSIIMLFNALGIAICIALLDLNGVSANWLLSLIFHGMNLTAFTIVMYSGNYEML